LIGGESCSWRQGRCQTRSERGSCSHVVAVLSLGAEDTPESVPFRQRREDIAGFDFDARVSTNPASIGGVRARVARIPRLSLPAPRCPSDNEGRAWPRGSWPASGAGRSTPLPVMSARWPLRSDTGSRVAHGETPFSMTVLAADRGRGCHSRR
jgi:hypothetical protein